MYKYYITMIVFTFNRYCLPTTVKHAFASTVKYFAIGNATTQLLLQTQWSKSSTANRNPRPRQTVIYNNRKIFQYVCGLNEYIYMYNIYSYLYVKRLYKCRIHVCFQLKKKKQTIYKSIIG